MRRLLFAAALALVAALPGQARNPFGLPSPVDSMSPIRGPATSTGTPGGPLTFTDDTPFTFTDDTAFDLTGDE